MVHDPHQLWFDIKGSTAFHVTTPGKGSMRGERVGLREPFRQVFLRVLPTFLFAFSLFGSVGRSILRAVIQQKRKKMEE